MSGIAGDGTTVTPPTSSISSVVGCVAATPVGHRGPRARRADAKNRLRAVHVAYAALAVRVAHRVLVALGAATPVGPSGPPVRRLGAALAAAAAEHRGHERGAGPDPPPSPPPRLSSPSSPPRLSGIGPGGTTRATARRRSRRCAAHPSRTVAPPLSART
jgi:hypothetical protein